MASTKDSDLQTSFEESIRQCIQAVSKSSIYQYKLVAFFTVVALTTTLQIFSSSLFYMNPVFSCAESQEKLFEEDACPQINFCKITNSETITAELALYCDSRKADRTLIQTGAAFGCWIGLILAALSDRLGKKFSFCLSLLLLNLSWMLQFTGVHFSSVSLLFVSEVISGMSNKVIYVSFLVLLTRFLQKENYELGTLVWFIAFHGMSQVIIAALNSAFHDWRAIAYIYAAGISLCSVAAFFILREDPVFLFDIGNISQVKRIVEEVGRQNGVEEGAIQQSIWRIDELFEEKMRRVENGFERKENFNIRDILRSDIIQAVIIIGLAGAFYQMGVRSIELSIQSMENSYNFNLFLIGLSSICGFSTAIYVSKIEPQQKRGLISSSLMYGVIALLFLFPFCYQNGSVETIVVFCLRFLLCWSCNFYTRLKVDSFPLRYQMTIIGFVQFLTTFGLVAAPTLVQRSIDRDINPIISVNFLRIIIGTLPLFFYVEQRIHLQPDKSSSDEDSRDEKKFEILQ